MPYDNFSKDNNNLKILQIEPKTSLSRLVMQMTDKRDPYHGSDRANSADDDAIIDLTEEVKIKPEGEDDVLELGEDLSVDAPKTDTADNGSGIDNDIFTLDETASFESQEDDVLLGLSEEEAADENQMGENKISASAIEEPLGFDEAEEFSLKDEFNLHDPDDEDMGIADKARQDDDGGIAAISDGGADAQKDEDIFDLEKEIELDYELDDDEDEMSPIEDQRGEGYQDFVSMVFGESEKSESIDMSEEPTEYINLGKGEPENMLGFETDQEEETEIIARADDETVPELDDLDDLPDMENFTGFELEDDDEDDVASPDEEAVENSDDIIARTVQQSMGAAQEADNFQPAEKFGLESEDADDLLALDDDRRSDEKIVTLTKEGTLEFADGDDLLDLDADELNAEDEIIPLDGIAEIDDEKNENITEITEFDQHFPDKDEALFEQAGLLNPARPEEEDFVELIDIENDSPAEDDLMTGFGEAAEEIEYAALDRFFNEDLEEEEPEEDENKASVFRMASTEDETETKTDEPFFRDLMGRQFKAESEADMPGSESYLEETTSAPTSEDDRFDFDVDPGTIAQQVDQLDTFLSEDSSDEPAEASLQADQADEDEPLEADRDTGAALPITPGQIDAAIEHVISEKFSGKIENIIYEVIEKAVSKEIERLKEILLENSLPEKDQ
jgi:hypothetical protein